MCRDLPDGNEKFAHTHFNIAICSHLQTNSITFSLRERWETLMGDLEFTDHTARRDRHDDISYVL